MYHFDGEDERALFLLHMYKKKKIQVEIQIEVQEIKFGNNATLHWLEFLPSVVSPLWDLFFTSLQKSSSLCPKLSLAPI